jgi:hypothetical protein
MRVEGSRDRTASAAGCSDDSVLSSAGGERVTAVFGDEAVGA